MMLYVCAITAMVNLSTEPWNNRDFKEKAVAERVCMNVYKDCLRKFVKKAPLIYHGVCGGREK